jgi:hypothetical protein
MLDRRRFLLRAGGLVTAAFVRKATSYSRTEGEPLILPSAGRPEETLCVYSQNWIEPRYGKWRVSLGPNQPFAPPPPTWREHLLGHGYRLDTAEDLERIYFEKGLTPEDLDKPLDGYGWEDMWDNFTGPQAKAHHLLKTLDLGAPDSKLRQADQIIFESFGASPGSSNHWVDLTDDFTVSLLQAHLIESNLPINVEVRGSWANSTYSGSGAK